MIRLSNRFALHRVHVLLWLLTAAGLSACSDDRHPHADGGEDAHAETEEVAKGPNGGRWLEQDGFALEVVIFETGVPPEFHLYAYQDGQPLAAQQVQARIELHRLGDGVDEFRFSPAGDHLKGDGVVTEPHSFDVKVRASFNGRDYAWDYASHEGRTTIDPQVAKAAGIRVEPVGPGEVRVTETLRGRIVPAPGAVRSVRARFPGLVKQVFAEVGDVVEAGQRLAVIESDESLRSYTLKAPIAGVVTARHRHAGDPVAAEPLFDLRQPGAVVAELQVHAGQRGRVRVGQSVQLRATGHEGELSGRVQAMLPVLDAASQSQLARVSLSADAAGWLPGSFVTASVVVDTIQAPLVVRERALQAFRDFTVVYAQVGDTYEVRMLELGARDGEFVEVLGGIHPGTRYVVDNSYLIKADVEKSGASHDH